MQGPRSSRAILDGHRGQRGVFAPMRRPRRIACFDVRQPPTGSATLVEPVPLPVHSAPEVMYSTQQNLPNMASTLPCNSSPQFRNCCVVSHVPVQCTVPVISAPVVPTCSQRNTRPIASIVRVPCAPEVTTCTNYKYCRNPGEERGRSTAGIIY